MLRIGATGSQIARRAVLGVVGGVALTGFKLGQHTHGQDDLDFNQQADDDESILAIYPLPFLPNGSSVKNSWKIPS
jgi:hypothetical protein